jgi:hypothetical protein
MKTNILFSVAILSLLCTSLFIAFCDLIFCLNFSVLFIKMLSKLMLAGCHVYDSVFSLSSYHYLHSDFTRLKYYRYGIFSVSHPQNCYTAPALGKSIDETSAHIASQLFKKEHKLVPVCTCKGLGYLFRFFMIEMSVNMKRKKL